MTARLKYEFIKNKQTITKNRKKNKPIKKIPPNQNKIEKQNNTLILEKFLDAGRGHT